MTSMLELNWAIQVTALLEPMWTKPLRSKEAFIANMSLSRTCPCVHSYVEQANQILPVFCFSDRSHQKLDDAT